MFVTHSAKTEIIKRSLSPTWDQTLIFESIEIHGDPSDIAANPPQIMIEIFDHDFYVRINLLSLFNLILISNTSFLISELEKEV